MYIEKLFDNNNYVVQNSMCFVGKESFINSANIFAFLDYMIDKCRVRKVFFLSPDLFSSRIYDIVSNFRRRRKIFSRILVATNNYLESLSQDFIFKKYEAYIPIDYDILNQFDLSNPSYILNEYFLISLSTYVVIISNKPLDEKELSLYDFAKNKAKEIFFL